jgi:hypothetical protein
MCSFDLVRQHPGRRGWFRLRSRIAFKTIAQLGDPALRRRWLGHGRLHPGNRGKAPRGMRGLRASRHWQRLHYPNDIDLGFPGRSRHGYYAVDTAGGRRVRLDADRSVDTPDPKDRRGRFNPGGQCERNALNRDLRCRLSTDVHGPKVDGRVRKAQARPGECLFSRAGDGPTVIVDHPHEDASRTRRGGQIVTLG